MPLVLVMVVSVVKTTMRMRTTMMVTLMKMTMRIMIDDIDEGKVKVKDLGEDEGMIFIHLLHHLLRSLDHDGGRLSSIGIQKLGLVLRLRTIRYRIHYRRATLSSGAGDHSGGGDYRTGQLTETETFELLYTFPPTILAIVIVLAIVVI